MSKDKSKDTKKEKKKTEEKEKKTEEKKEEKKVKKNKVDKTMVLTKTFGQALRLINEQKVHLWLC